MYYKVRIKSLPKAKVGYQVDGSLANDVLSFGDSKSKPDLKVNKFITAVPRKEANLEAEGGELVYGDLDGDNFLENTVIKGPRHSNGGVPLKLPDDTFIFSDTAGMKINDPIILKMFGKLSKKGKGNKGFTPASLAKQYDIDSYRKILQDPNSDAISIKTAELMIKNYNMKLGALALAQEAKKGFPQGIPTVAESYMEMMGIDPKDILPPELPEPMSPEQLNQGDMQEQPIEEDPTSDQMANDDTLTQSPPNLEQYAQPDESQMGQEESFANPDEMMQYGGMRRLRRAQEGMQQMSEEEMMALEQEQAQLQANQQMSGQNEGMMQEEPQIDEEKIQLITQQVEQALQQGAPPEEIVTQLLKAQISPDLIEEIFVELGMPQQEVKQLLMSLIQNVENEQAQQIDPRQQQQQMSEEDMMAMQQQDPRQMQQAPMAAYGMEMGGYDMPFADNSYEMAFGGQKKFNKNHVTVLKFVGGGEPPEGSKIIRRVDYQTDELYKAAVKREMYNNRASGIKVYTQNKDGKFSSVSEVEDDGSNARNYKFKDDAEAKSWNNKNGAASRFASMQKSLSDPVVAALFAKSTREAIKDKESYRKKGPGNNYNTTWAEAGYKNPDDLSDEEIVKSFLDFQERNLKLASSGNEAFLYNDVDGKLRKKNGTGIGDALGFVDLMKGLKKQDGSKMYTDAEIETKYNDMLKNAPSLDQAFKNIGLPITAVNKGKSPENQKARLQQATFIGYDNLMKKKRDGTLTADETYLLDEWKGNLERGYNDEKLGAGSRISPAEGWLTNTASGQNANKIENSIEETLLVEDKPCVCTVDGKEVPGVKNTKWDSSKPEDANNMPCEPCKEPDKPNEECQCLDESLDTFRPLDEDGNCTCNPSDEEDKWWLQDNVNVMGALSDLASIKKYLPWAPKLDLEEPRPTFLDPTRELAAQSEQANIASQASASFAGAQGLGARNAATQGNAAAQAANTLSNINNQNVNIANQFEDKQVNIRNQETVGNQQIATQMYDKNTIANQQFDNSKLALTGLARKHYNNAVTNKANTAMLNRLHPNQRVRPEDGGMPESVDSGREVDGTRTSNGYDNLLEECKLLYPGASVTDLNNCVKTKSTFKESTTTNSGGLINSYPGSAQYGGQQPIKQFKYGGFIYNVYPDY
jgi:hypothetical protein